MEFVKKAQTIHLITTERTENVEIEARDYRFHSRLQSRVKSAKNVPKNNFFFLPTLRLNLSSLLRVEFRIFYLYSILW